MGTRSFIIIKIRKSITENRLRKKRSGKTEKIKINLDSCLNQFSLMQYNQYDGHINYMGKEILKFLRKIMEENRWEEFVQKCKKIKNNLNEKRNDNEWSEMELVNDIAEPILRDSINVAFSKIKTAYTKDDDKDMYMHIERDWRYPPEIKTDLFDKITHSPETLQKVINSTKSYNRNTGSGILDMIMNNQLHKSDFCDKDWPSDCISCEYGYLIDCTTKEFLIYSTSRRSYESKVKDTDEEDDDELSTEDPISFLNPITLVGRLSLDKLPSNKEFFKMWDNVYWKRRIAEKSGLKESDSEESEE